MPHYLMQFFEYKHLPEHLQPVSKAFADLAATVDTYPENPEKTTALRKLLEAKDCAVRSWAVRSWLFKDGEA
jgi:ferritin-like protein